MFKKLLRKLLTDPSTANRSDESSTDSEPASRPSHGSSGQPASGRPASTGRPDSGKSGATNASSRNTSDRNTSAGRPVGGRPGASREPIPEPSVVPIEGKHVGHYLYRFRREAIADKLLEPMRQQLTAALDPGQPNAPERLASYWVSGHEADFAVMVIDDDPSKVDGIHQQLMTPGLGRVLEPTYSFVSMTEISEYVPSVEQFRERLIKEGTQPGPELDARVAGYEKRLPIMNASRICPEIPDWPAFCIYPMNKVRHVGANWFTEPFSHRRALMAEHADSGIAFAGKVSQLISVGVGLDDWEWMVTLWGRNPQYLKEIVYRMRFDEASAKYAEFGPFYTGYKADAEAILRHCRLG